MTWKAFWGGLAVLPVLFLAVFFAYPVVTMLATGFGDGSFFEVALKDRNLRVLAQTLIQAAAGTAGSLLLGIPGAYVLYKLDFPGVWALRTLAIVPFVLPTVVVGVAFRGLLGRGGPLEFLGLDETIWAVIMALVFFNFSVVVRTVGTVWRALDENMVAAARTLGATPLRAFRTVTLPQLLPAIGSAGTIVFLFCATSYGLVRTLGSPGYGTLETEIWRQATGYLNMSAAAILAIIQIIVVVGVLLLSGYFARRAVTVNMRGVRHRPSAGDVPALILTITTLALLIAAPLATLVIRSFKTREGWSLENYRRLATPGEGFSGGATVTEAMMNSLQTALLATIISLAVGSAIALVLSRRVSGWAGGGQMLIGGLMLLPLGVSAVTVGFGFTLALDSPPLDLRNSDLLIPIAQAVVAVPLVVSSMTPLLKAIEPAQREAARTLGASRWRTLATIDGPVMARGMAVASGFALAASLGEFGATSFLSRPDTITLPVMIVRLLGRPGAHNYGMAMAAAVILALVTMAIMSMSEAKRD